MTKKRIAGLIACTIVVGTLAAAALNPLRRSPEKIRASLFDVLPIGSTVDAVLRLAENRGWAAEKLHTGFVRDTDLRSVVGTSSVRLMLGEYHEIPIPLATSVEAFFGFDSTGRLLDIAVRKSTDAP